MTSRAKAKLAAAALMAVPAAILGQSITDSTIPLSTHASGFSLPTAIEFLGNSPTDFFITEKNTGRVKRSLDGVTSIVLDLNVANASEQGLLGMALPPDFATASTKYVYLYYSKPATAADGGTWQQNRLSRFVWNGTNLTSTSEEHLATFGTSADGVENGPNHDAGPILFGPDGKLYGTTGDLNRNLAEQNYPTSANTSSKVGGIYRLNPDGSVPGDNPFASAGNTDFHRWYAYGVRNTFGLNVDPLTGALWDTENGPSSYDEVNRVDEGFNSGWERIMGPDSRDTDDVDDLVHLSGSHYSDPEFSWLSPVAPTGLTFLAESTLDINYRDAMLVGDNNNSQLYLYRLNNNRDGFVLSGGLADLVADDATERNSVRFGQNFGPLSELTTGPDGGIYVTSLVFPGVSTGGIFRIGLKSWKLDANGSWGTAANWQGGTPRSRTREFLQYHHRAADSHPQPDHFRQRLDLPQLASLHDHRPIHVWLICRDPRRRLSPAHASG